MQGLIAHTDTFRTDREFLRTIPAPQPTATWKPIPHIDVAEAILNSARDAGYIPAREEYAVNKEGSKLFGVITFQADGDLFTETTKMIGFRHANDKSMSLSLTIGARVFVCDNMCFAGERVLRHKHSIHFDITMEVPRLFENLDAKFVEFGNTVEVMKHSPLGISDARSIVVDSALQGIVAPKYVVPIVEAYEQPEHADAFPVGNRWSLYNAFTSVAKRMPPATFDTAMRGLSQYFQLGGVEAVG